MAQTVREVMSPDPMALSASVTIGDAARAMRERDLGDVLVLDGDNALCGIVTDRDIVVARRRRRPESGRGASERHLQQQPCHGGR